MKNFVFMVGSALVGGLVVKAASTERGERVLNWAKGKLRDQTNKVANKLDKLTTTETAPEEDCFAPEKFEELDK